MTFIILFCLLLDHQVVAGVMEQRQLRSEVSTTRVGPSESSFHKIPETEDSTRNLPTNDSNKLVADQSTNTDTRGRINLTAAKETASISRPPADSKQSERRLKDRWVLKKTIRRNLMMRSALERKIASRISAMSPHLAADNTKRILRMKSETEAVFPRKASKHNRLHRKFSSESRRVHSSADYFANALIFDTAYLKSDSRRNLGVVVAQQKDPISAKGIEPKRLVEKSRVYNSPLMVADSKAKGKGEWLGYQAMDPELKSLSGLPSAFVDENVGMKKDETGFLHNFLNGESSNTEVQIDKKSKRVKREDITPAPGIDSTSAETTAGLAIVFGAEPNVTVAQHGIVEPNVTVAPHVTVAPNNSETTIIIPRLEIPTGDFRLPNEGEPLGVPRVKGGSAIGEEEPASEKDVEEKPIDSNGHTLHAEITTAQSNSTSSKVLIIGVVGGIVVVGVLGTIGVFIYLKRKKRLTNKKAEKSEKEGKGEKEPLKPGAAKPEEKKGAKKDSKAQLKSSPSKSAAKTKDAAKDAAKPPAAPPPPNAAAAKTPAKPK